MGERTHSRQPVAASPRKTHKKTQNRAAATMPQAGRKINRAPLAAAVTADVRLDFRNVGRRRLLNTTKLKFRGEIERAKATRAVVLYGGVRCNITVAEAAERLGAMRRLL